MMTGVWIHKACGGRVDIDPYYVSRPGKLPITRYRCTDQCIRGGTGWQVGHPSDDPTNFAEIAD